MGGCGQCLPSRHGTANKAAYPGVAAPVRTPVIGQGLSKAHAIPGSQREAIPTRTRPSCSWGPGRAQTRSQKSKLSIHQLQLGRVARFEHKTSRRRAFVLIFLTSGLQLLFSQFWARSSCKRSSCANHPDELADAGVLGTCCSRSRTCEFRLDNASRLATT